MGIDTAKITEASKALVAANKTYERLLKNDEKVIANAIARVKKSRAKKVETAKAAVVAAEVALQTAAQGN